MSGQDTVNAFTAPIPSFHSIQGLSSIESEARRKAGKGAVPPAPTGRTYAQVVREDVFPLVNVCSICSAWRSCCWARCLKHSWPPPLFSAMPSPARCRKCEPSARWIALPW